VNRYLQQWGYDRTTLSRQPAAVRFQAEHSNDCWQFDMSPSDLKQIKKPSWVRDDGTPPTLMLFSAVDDRSGAAYQEYRCVYGEDAGAALRFLFNAMAADVVGLFSINVGSFSRNVGRSVRIFSTNVGQKHRTLSGPASYVLGPLQLAK
jgi:hypothetical protein